MTFKDLPEGTTHYYNDGCGIPEHNNPTVEGTDTEEAWVEDAKYLCSPLAERMPDGVRLTALIHVATKMIDTLQSTRADERKKLVKVVKGMQEITKMNHNGCYPKMCGEKTLEDVLAKISQV